MAESAGFLMLLKGSFYSHFIANEVESPLDCTLCFDLVLLEQDWPNKLVNRLFFCKIVELLLLVNFPVCAHVRHGAGAHFLHSKILLSLAFQFLS